MVDERSGRAFPLGLLATLGVLALVGLFLWLQLAGGADGQKENSVVASAGSAPGGVSPAANHHPERPAHIGVRQGRSSAVAAVDGKGGGKVAVPVVSSCEPVASGGLQNARGASTPPSVGCGVEVPALTAEERAQGVAVEVDEEIIGGEIEIVPSRYVNPELDTRANGLAATRQALAPSVPAITTVALDVAANGIELVGIAPPHVHRLTLIIDGKERAVSPVNEQGRWRARIDVDSGDALYIQLRGENARGERVAPAGKMQSAYVVSLQEGEGQAEAADVVVVPGQYSRVAALADAYALARELGGDIDLLNRVNGLHRRAYREGEPLFIPYATVQ